MIKYKEFRGERTQEAAAAKTGINREGWPAERFLGALLGHEMAIWTVIDTHANDLISLGRARHVPPSQGQR